MVDRPSNAPGSPPDPEFAARLLAATEQLDELQLADLSEPSTRALDGAADSGSAPHDELAGPAAADPGPAPAAAQVSSASMASMFRPAEPAGGLAVDWERSGREVAAQPATLEPVEAGRPGDGGERGGAGWPAGAPTWAGASAIGPSPAPRRGIDRLALVLGIVGLGLGLAWIPALGLAERALEARTYDGLRELEDALARPLAVQAGQARRPAEIADELRSHVPAARRRFFGVWLLLSLPAAGLGLWLAVRD